MIITKLIRRRTSTLSQVFQRTTSLHSTFIARSIEAYKANKLETDKELDKLFTSNRIVLFSEGSIDAPKSELSLNVIRMLTEVQAVPLAQVDILAHPAIQGYTVHKSGSHSPPHLYVGGSFYGDHDKILQKYKTGELLAIGSAKSGDLTPIGLY
jgi:glutaredoxin-related protein